MKKLNIYAIAGALTTCIVLAALWVPILFPQQARMVPPLLVPIVQASADSTLELSGNTSALRTGWYTTGYDVEWVRWDSQYVIDFADAAPTTGYWEEGCVVFNTSPSDGTSLWQCTATGTPGTWTAIANGL